MANAPVRTEKWDAAPPVFASRHRSRQPYNTSFHLHESYELYLLVDGKLDYFVEDACYRLSPGDLLLFDDKTIHKCSNLNNDLYERATVHFSPYVARELGTDKTDLLACFETAAANGAIFRLSPAEMETYLRIIDRIVQVGSDRETGADVLRRAYLMELLVFVNRCCNRRHATHTLPERAPAAESRLRPLLEYIEDHLTDDLSLDAMALGLSMSKSSISHIFREETGSTPSKYVNARRIALAKHLLRSGRTVTEACLQSGFNDYANFIRVFREATGVPPGRYKKEAV